MTAVIPLLQAFVLFCGRLGHLKVNLAQIDVGTHDGDHHGIAQAPVPAGDGVGQAHALGVTNTHEQRSNFFANATKQMQQSYVPSFIEQPFLLILAIYFSLTHMILLSNPLSFY